MSPRICFIHFDPQKHGRLFSKNAICFFYFEANEVIAHLLCYQVSSKSYILKNQQDQRSKDNFCPYQHPSNEAPTTLNATNNKNTQTTKTNHITTNQTNTRKQTNHNEHNIPNHPIAWPLCSEQSQLRSPQWRSCHLAKRVLGDSSPGTGRAAAVKTWRVLKDHVLGLHRKAYNII